MTVLAFGRATEGDGVELLAAALASLAVGLFPYGAFLLLARAWYALGDSRTPALAATVPPLVGVAVMVVVGSRTEGTARLVVLGRGPHASRSCSAPSWLGDPPARRRRPAGSADRRPSAGRSPSPSVVGLAWRGR